MVVMAITEEAVVLDAVEVLMDAPTVPVVTLKEIPNVSRTPAKSIPIVIILGTTVLATRRINPATITMVDEETGAVVRLTMAAVETMAAEETAAVVETVAAVIKVVAAVTTIITTAGIKITITKIRTTIMGIVTTTTTTTIITTITITKIRTTIKEIETTTTIITTIIITNKTTIGWIAFSGETRTRLMMVRLKKITSHHFPTLIQLLLLIKSLSLSC
jgi:hypothetical protein